MTDKRLRHLETMEGGTVVGSGATPQIAYWTAANTLAGDTLLVVDTANNRIGAGTTTPDRSLHAEVADAVTNAVTYTSRDTHTTSGAAAALYGVGHEDELEDSAGNMQVASEQATLWSDATTAVESPLLRWAVYPKGTVGPGYKGLWGWHDLDDTVRTVIPNGTGDVTAVLYVHWVIVLSDGNIDSGTAEIPNAGSTYLYNAGGEEYPLYVNADGSVTLYRDAGATTADVMLDLLWI